VQPFSLVTSVADDSLPGPSPPNPIISWTLLLLCSIPTLRHPMILSCLLLVSPLLPPRHPSAMLIDRRLHRRECMVRQAEIKIVHGVLKSCLLTESENAKENCQHLIKRYIQMATTHAHVRLLLPSISRHKGGSSVTRSLRLCLVSLSMLGGCLGMALGSWS
jgi:hypothetical protein